MENIEGSQQPEQLVSDENIVEVFEALKEKIPPEYEWFEFNGIGFQIIYIEEKEQISDNEDVFYSASTEIPGGFDIYLYKQLSREEKQRRLFHEIIEIGAGRKVYTDEAHKFALRKEEELFGKRQ